MRTDFFTLIKGKKRYAYRIVLCQRLADNLTILIFNLIFKNEHFSFRYIFHMRSPFFIKIFIVSFTYAS